MPPRARLAFALLVSCALGCQCFVPVSERSGAGGGQRTTSSAWETPEEWAEAGLVAVYCGQADACGGYASGVTCDDLINHPGRKTMGFWGPQLAHALDAGTVRFDPDAGRACLAAWENTCGAGNCVRDVFRGTLDAGQSCTSNYECGAGLWCDLDCRRMCVPQLGDGADVPSLGACLSQEATVLVDGGWRCQSPRPRGAPCAPRPDEEYPAWCADGLWCVGGVCDDPLGEGATCEPHERWSECARSLFCDASTRRCVRTAAVGEPCTTCEAGLACSPTTQTCALPARRGEACGHWYACAAPFACRGGVCVELGKPGAPCATALDCEGALVCTRAGTCGLGSEAGTSCSDASDCAQGLSCPRGTCALTWCG